MVQTAPADQPPVPGTIAVRVLGVLLILHGGLRLYGTINLLLAFQRGNYRDDGVFNFTTMVLTALGLLTVSAGILLVRRDPAGRFFGLAVCSIALAYQILSFGSALTFLYILAPSPTRSLGMVFWLINAGSIVLFLVSIIAIACWHPHRVPGR